MRPLPLRVAILLTGVSLVAGSFSNNANAADVVLLRNGTHYEGEIVDQKPGARDVVLNTGLKSMHILKIQIKRVIKDDAARVEYRRRFGAIRGQNAAAHYELYKWTKEKRLYSFAEKELERTIAIDSNHAKARQALGHVYQDGKWLTEDEAETYEQEESIQIGAATSNTQKKEERIKLHKKMVGMANKLGRSDTAKSEKEEIVAYILSDRKVNGHVLLGCLDFRKIRDEETRQGALKGLEVAKPVSLTASTTLAWTAVNDPSSDMRDSAVDLIKTRKDDKAIGRMMGYLMSSFSKSGKVLNAPMRNAAVKGLRRINDPRVLDGLIYYVVLEMRPTVTDLVSFKTRQIDSFTINQGANASLVIPLSFPIQFPELAIKKVRTTVSAPASAVQALTRQGLPEILKNWRAGRK